MGKWSAVAELPGQPQIQVMGQSSLDKGVQRPQTQSPASQILFPSSGLRPQSHVNPGQVVSDTDSVLPEKLVWLCPAGPLLIQDLLL